FLIPPDLLRPYLSPLLELDLYEGKACISLVAVTMRKFRGYSPFSFGSLFRLIGCQRFLNLRTYVRFRSEPGALFLWGWLSNPFFISLPCHKIGLPCAFAEVEFDHGFGAGFLKGTVRGKSGSGTFEYHGSIDPNPLFGPCRKGSLAE